VSFLRQNGEKRTKERKSRHNPYLNTLCLLTCTQKFTDDMGMRKILKSCNSLLLMLVNMYMSLSKEAALEKP
jgi:hypothetical protein